MEDLRHIERVTVQPGDRFVVTTPDRLPDVIMARIAEYAANRLGVPVDRVLVLDGGMKLSVAGDLPPELFNLPVAQPYKPTALTEAGSIAAGGSALVRAFIENVGFAYKAQDNEALLRDFSAFAVDQLKARTLGADFQITPPAKPSDTSVVTTVDFGKGGAMQGFRRTEQLPDGTVVDLTTMGD